MRFRLTAPHNLQRLINGRAESVLVDRGAEVDSADYADFAPTPAMIALDPAAEAAQLAVCDRARGSLGFGQFSSGAEIPGYGNEHLMPGGDLYGKPPTDP